MKFVLGRPVKNCETCWYLVLDNKEADCFAAAILIVNAREFLRDPHKSTFSRIAALASTDLALKLETGLHDRRVLHGAQRWHVSELV